jgi:hypothetical protein
MELANVRLLELANVGFLELANVRLLELANVELLELANVELYNTWTQIKKYYMIKACSELGRDFRRIMCGSAGPR